MLDADIANAPNSGRSMVAPLLTALSPDQAEHALRPLPQELQDRLSAMSPLNYLDDLRAPLIVLLHDRDDVVVPVGESRSLRDALATRGGVRYPSSRSSNT